MREMYKHCAAARRLLLCLLQTRKSGASDGQHPPSGLSNETVPCSLWGTPFYFKKLAHICIKTYNVEDIYSINPLTGKGVQNTTTKTFWCFCVQSANHLSGALLCFCWTRATPVIISYSSSHLLEGELMLKPNIHAFSMSVSTEPSRNPI
jgi:hypothetical protein